MKPTDVTSDDSSKNAVRRTERDKMQHQRQAEALRQNLHRRKAQAKARSQAPAVTDSDLLDDSAPDLV